MRRNVHADRISQRSWGRTSAKNCGTAPTPFTGHPKALRPLKSTLFKPTCQECSYDPYSPPYHLESPQLRPPNPLSISAAATFTHRPPTLQGHTTTLLRPSQANLRPLQHQDKSSSSWLGTRYSNPLPLDSWQVAHEWHGGSRSSWFALKEF